MGEDHRARNLEDAIVEASNFASVACGYIGSALCFGTDAVPTLTSEDCERLMYAVGKVTDLINDAKRAFYTT